MSGRLASRTDLSVVLSLAGRTASPQAHDVPLRSGGFGGSEGLAAYLERTQTDLLIDATHPHAGRISANAAEAAERTGVPLIALVRPEWRPLEGDRWTFVDSVAEAVGKLGAVPRRVFVTLGRQELAPLADAPQHHYLIRSVDPVDPPLALPQARYLLARGPFAEDDERALLLAERIEIVIAKNSGGAATYGKIAAARALGLPVLLLRRPPHPGGRRVETVEEAVAMLDHLLAVPAAKRGE